MFIILDRIENIKKAPPMTQKKAEPPKWLFIYNYSERIKVYEKIFKRQPRGPQ